MSVTVEYIDYSMDKEEKICEMVSRLVLVARELNEEYDSEEEGVDVERRKMLASKFDEIRRDINSGILEFKKISMRKGPVVIKT